jgi:hypothetical protein
VYTEGTSNDPPHTEHLAPYPDEVAYHLLEGGFMKHEEGLKFRDMFMPYGKRHGQKSWQYTALEGQIRELLVLADTLGMNDETVARFYERMVVEG